MMHESAAFDHKYIDHGSGDTIILLHGQFCNLSNWLSVVDHFKDDYRVIIPRLPIFEGPRKEANLGRLVVLLHEFIQRER